MTTRKATQIAMIAAAAAIEALIPKKPKGLQADRNEQLVYSVYYQAARAAYLRAAQECLNAGYDAFGTDAHEQINLEHIHYFLAAPSTDVQSLKLMCEPGYFWGGSVKTL